MKLFTIGFTKKSAEEFFTRLQEARVKRVVDVRLNNTSQLAGFAKARDLPYLLRATSGIDYIHAPEFAPTQEMLDAYKKQKGSWDEYEPAFIALMLERDIRNGAGKTLRESDCLLCSEDTPDQCHRRLIVEHLQQHDADIEVVHL